MFSPGFFKESLGGFRTWLDDRKPRRGIPPAYLTHVLSCRFQSSEMPGSHAKMRMS